MSADTSWRNKSIGDIFSRSPQPSSLREDLPLELPQVNLLPTSIAAGIAMRKIRRAGTFAGMVILLIAGLLWAAQIPAIRASQEALVQAQSTNANEQAQVQALAPIAQMVTQIRRQEDLVRTTMASQPKVAAIYQQLLAAASAAGYPAVRFTTLAVVYTPASANRAAQSACPDPDPFAQHVTIGCATFNASAQSRDQVSRLLVALGRDPLFVGPYVNSSTLANAAGTGQQAVSFTGTVGISPAGLATPLTKEQVAQLLNPPAPPGSGNGGAQ
ncbi:MAG: hypothetical protein Q8L05_11225 [Actinomycetota bacterium]|nr:hypothetical protein [Actinomycetota bacterium]MDP2289394.1 hypothetical protein [Actinomycetota bacterium]